VDRGASHGPGQSLPRTVSSDIRAVVSRRPTGATVSWGLNSLVMLSLALILLLLTVRRVRRVAVAGIGRGPKIGESGRWPCGQTLPLERRYAGRVAGPIRHVTGSPVVWKETRRGLLYGWSLSDIVISAIALAASVIPSSSSASPMSGRPQVWGWSSAGSYRFLCLCA